MNDMKKLSLVWGLLLVLIVVGLTIIGMNWKKKNADYKTLETKLSEATKKYVDASTISGKTTIDFQDLIDAKLIDNMNVGEDTCKGHVIIESNGMVYEYKAYLKCNEYTTKDYQEQ